MPTFRGKNACDCLVQWLPVYEAKLLELGVIVNSLDIFQLTGTAAASAGTHTGGAFDIAQTQDLAIWVARQMGADATWHRPYNWNGKGGVAHTHGVLRGCPHNAGGRYQIAAVDEGYDGLGSGGRGGRDTGPRPLSGRTWQQGIEWARRPVLDVLVATANVQENPRHDKTIGSDLAKVVTGVDVVLWQELGPKVYKDRLRAIKRLQHEIVLGDRGDYSTPISLDPKLLKPFARNAKLLQPGKANFNPNLHLTTVRTRVLGTPKARVVFRSGHLINRAFRADGSKRPRPNVREAAQQAVRQVIWFAGRRKLMRQVRRDAKDGLAQVFGVDQNRKDVPLMKGKIAGRKVHAVSHGIDWIYFVDGADFVWELVGSKQLIKHTGDHPAVVQRAQLRPRKR